MIKLTWAAAALAAGCLLAGPASAVDWSRSWTGPNGGTRSVSGECGGRSCSRTVDVTGPGGRSWSSTGRVVQGPFRSYGYRTVTGPAGHGYTVGRAWRRY
jgi:hypothetical protein